MRAIKPIEKSTTGDPELADRFDRVLSQAVQAMEESGIRYVFIGGIASGGLGRPRSTRDIDIFVMPEDAEAALRALARRGFRTEKTDPTWLYKGFKEDILVDVIFRSKGEIYLDSEMYQRMITAEYHGQRLRLVAPEDLLILKAAAHSELTPGHWHDAIALLSHSNLDWEYLIRRAKRAPRRVMSLLLYAQSNDIWVPNRVIHSLYRVIFGDEEEEKPEAKKIPEAVVPPRFSGGPPPVREVELPQPRKGREGGLAEYPIAHLREALAEDPRTNELDLQVEQAGNHILLRGEVSIPERKKAAEEIARERFPGFVIENHITVLSPSSSPVPEALE